MLYELLDADASPLWQGVGKWGEFLESETGNAKIGEFYLNCGINHRFVEMNLYKVLTNMHCWIGKVIFLTNTCPFCWTRLQLWQSLSYMPPKQSASLALALHVSLPAKRPSVRQENITAKFILCGTTTTKQISKKENFWSKKKHLQVCIWCASCRYHGSGTLRAFQGGSKTGGKTGNNSAIPNR